MMNAKDLFHTLDLFEGLTSDMVADAIGGAAPTLSHMTADTWLFLEDDPAQTCHIVIAGQIRLTKHSADGHQTLFSLVGARHTVDVTAIAPGAAYPVAAQTAVDSVVLSLTGELLRGLAERHPRVMRNALRILMERHRELQRAYQQLVSEPVQNRVARVLLGMASLDLHDPGGIVITASRQDVAALAGTTVFTVSRCLSVWERQGMLTSGRRQIILRDIDGLLSQAAGHTS